jgi:hypothetical protein
MLLKKPHSNRTDNGDKLAAASKQTEELDIPGKWCMVHVVPGE